MSKVRVYAPGVWDLIHIGHINFLKRAKKLGDVLIVGVQSDEEVEKQKGLKPAISLKDRIATLEALDCVDIAVPYSDSNYVEHAKSCWANVFVLSEENKYADRFKELRDYMGKGMAYLPYDKNISTTQIKNNIKNFWGDTWEKVASENGKDVEIVGHHDTDTTWKLAEYFISKLGIYPNEWVLDYGCGSGLILKELDCVAFGIDIAPSMLKRASNNLPHGLFMQSDHIPLVGHFDHVISWGVLHYLPSLEFVSKVIDEMKSLSSSILLMENPDVELRSGRLARRERLGKKLSPEPLYFSKDFFRSKGFKILKDDPKLTDNSEFSFSVIYDKV